MSKRHHVLEKVTLVIALLQQMRIRIQLAGQNWLNKALKCLGPAKKVSRNFFKKLMHIIMLQKMFQFQFLTRTSEAVQAYLQLNALRWCLKNSGFFAEKNLKMRLALARDPALIEDFQHILAEDKNISVREALADNYNLSDAVMILLAQDQESVRIKLAGTTHDTDIQLKLADDPSKSVRMALAEQRSLEPVVQYKLAHDTSRYIREALIKNRFLTESVQMIFARDERISIRKLIARFDEICERAQILLSKDSSISVRCSLATNSQVYSDIARRNLANDTFEVIRIALASSSGVGHYAQNTDIQFYLADDYSETVRSTLAENDSIHQDVMLKLAHDSSCLVRSALAQNNEIGNAVVERLKRYKELSD